MKVAPITTTDLQDIEEDIRLNDPAYKAEGEKGFCFMLGVETALTAVWTHIIKQADLMEKVGMEEYYKLIDEDY
jgi:hypothetical protein